MVLAAGQESANSKKDVCKCSRATTVLEALESVGIARTGYRQVLPAMFLQPQKLDQRSPDHTVDALELDVKNAGLSFPLELGFWYKI
jgi:hypothetical protein